MVKNVQKRKYLCRYRTCFIIGIVILSAHILLLANFFASNKSLSENLDQWGSSNSGNREETGSNLLVGRSDDEETNLLAPQIKKTNISNTTLQIKIEDLNFELPCHIKEKQALSALSRAKNQNCKQLIANISCLSLEEGKLYPMALNSNCPAGNYIKGKQLGCYKDEKNFRLLNGYFTTNKINNSPQFCIDLCLQSGFPYAGVEYSEECFCGTENPLHSSKIPDSSCNMKCPADAHSTCGGYYTINIYQTGIKKFVPKTANDATTSMANPQVKLLFLLTLNGRALRQVKRLLKILYHQNHYYYIHVDVRQDYLFRELLFLEKYPNIRLTRHRFATIWGGASLLEMLRSCMLETLRMEHWKWDFILNLSESDFPVKPIKKLTEFLSANQNKNFVKSHGREVQRFIQKQGLDKIFIECEYRMWRIGNRKLPHGIQIDGGSDWIALSRPFVEYVANPKPDDLVSGLLNVFKHTLLPAESFFHTVLRNSKFCNSYVDNNLHVTNWKRKLGCKCQYKHVVDWCGCSPNDFRADDWTKILNTKFRPIYFARKFEPVVSQSIILQLELWLFNLDKTSKQVQNLHSYWQNLYHHYDMGITADETLHVLASSIARKTIKMYNSSNHTATCSIGNVGPLLQVHSFHYNDNYKSTLFHYATKSGHDVEVAIKPLNKQMIVIKNHQLNKYLISIAISTDYDQKEQLSRNFLRLISPHSDIFLIYKFHPFKSIKQYNFTCLWIDPLGNLSDLSTFAVDDATLVGMVKINLKPPHLPGVWKTKLLYNGHTLIAEVPFFVVPLPQVSLIFLDAIKTNSDIPHENSASEQYTEFLPSHRERAVLEKTVVENLQHQNDSLYDWIDKLVDDFFAIQRICLNVNQHQRGNSVCDSSVNSCHLTRWSSMAADPKSAIDSNNTINKTTGMFDVW